jgi:NADH:ubiquinone oxidoreductase subunit C
MSVLARRDRALTPEETEALLRDRLGDGILGSTLAHRMFTVHVAPSAWVETFERCRDEPLLDFDLFDSLHGVDAREEGFDVVAILYSTSTGNRLCLRTRCEGGREQPVCPSLTDVYRGADWMERETWDMFGIEFPGHPGARAAHPHRRELRGLAAPQGLPPRLPRREAVAGREGAGGARRGRQRHRARPGAR